MTTRSRWTWIWMVSLAGALWLAGCPSGDDDDSAAGDDDDTAADPTAPEISNLDIYVGVPDGEADEMLILAFDFHDDDGDIRDGEIRLFTSDDELIDGSDLAGVASLEDEQDAVDGSLMVYDDIGGISGFVPGAHYYFGIVLVDREGLESDQLEDEFTVPEE